MTVVAERDIPCTDDVLAKVDAVSARLDSTKERFDRAVERFNSLASAIDKILRESNDPESDTATTGG